MAGTASYRVTTADYEHTHAYITDRRYLESQTNEESEWGPVREKFSRNLLAAMTPLGDDLTNEGMNYLSHMWEDKVTWKQLASRCQRRCCWYRRLLSCCFVKLRSKSTRFLHHELPVAHSTRWL